MNSHLFLYLPIGALFFHDPSNQHENPSIKIENNKARKPNGDVVEVKGEELIFTKTLVKA